MQGDIVSRRFLILFYVIKIEDTAGVYGLIQQRKRQICRKNKDIVGATETVYK